MPKAAIAIDSWKTEIFERHLKQSGYSFQKGPGLTADMTLLTVVTDNLHALGEVAKNAAEEAARTGRP